VSSADRAAVAEELTVLSAPGAPLHRDSTDCTEYRYSPADRRRVRLHRDFIERYLSRQNPRRDGRSCIVSAGPPGAGKSSFLLAHISGLAEYRVIDADVVKDYLIEQALIDGIYEYLMVGQLADGYPVAPRELAALVHLESVKLADQIRRIAISRKENVVIEGTLTWQGQGPRIFRELADAEYLDVEVYGIDVDAHVAQEQALNRWWDGRRAWIAGADSLGGRFTPSDAINICYPAPGESLCITHARQFIDVAQSGEIPYVHVTILGRQSSGVVEVREEAFYRQ